MLTRSQLIKKSVLKYWLETPVDKLFANMKEFCRGQGETRHVFIDNGADILAVSHLDTVQDLSKKIKVTDKKIKASGLDDRLGAYTCAILSTIGIKADILLTDNEEIGRSTAQYFETDKRYKWVVEFDRMGSDIVTYGLDNDVFVGNIKNTGADKGFGSFSDLCYLQLPGNPCMLNVGIGYYQPHSVTSYARIREYVLQINRFKLFYERHKDTYFKQDNKHSRHKGSRYSTSKSYDNTDTVKISKKEAKELQDYADCATSYEDEWLNAYEDMKLRNANAVSECYYCMNQRPADEYTYACPECGAYDSYMLVDAEDLIVTTEELDDEVN